MLESPSPPKWGYVSDGDGVEPRWASRPMSHPARDIVSAPAPDWGSSGVVCRAGRPFFRSAPTLPPKKMSRGAALSLGHACRVMQGTSVRERGHRRRWNGVPTYPATAILRHDPVWLYRHIDPLSNDKPAGSTRLAASAACVELCPTSYSTTSNAAAAPACATVAC